MGLPSVPPYWGDQNVKQETMVLLGMALLTGACAHPHPQQPECPAGQRAVHLTASGGDAAPRTVCIEPVMEDDSGASKLPPKESEG